MRLFLLILSCSLGISLQANDPLPPVKVLLVKVDEIGLVTVGRDTVGSDHLARYIQERLFKSYLGTGQMYDLIRFEKADTYVPEELSQVVIREIRTGQEKALQVLCLQKFRKTYEMLDHKKKQKLQKQFPVLFQDQFTENV